MALALLRGLAKDEVRTGAWEENKVMMVIMVKAVVMMMIMVKAIGMATTTSVMIMAMKRITTTMQI